MCDSLPRGGSTCNRRLSKTISQWLRARGLGKPAMRAHHSAASHFETTPADATGLLATERANPTLGLEAAPERRIDHRWTRSSASVVAEKYFHLGDPRHRWSEENGGRGHDRASLAALRHRPWPGERGRARRARANLARPVQARTASRLRRAPALRRRRRARHSRRLDGLAPQAVARNATGRSGGSSLTTEAPKYPRPLGSQQTACADAATATRRRDAPSSTALRPRR